MLGMWLEKETQGTPMVTLLERLVSWSRCWKSHISSLLLFLAATDEPCALVSVIPTLFDHSTTALKISWDFQAVSPASCSFTRQRRPPHCCRPIKQHWKIIDALISPLSTTESQVAVPSRDARQRGKERVVKVPLHFTLSPRKHLLTAGLQCKYLRLLKKKPLLWKQIEF